MQLQTESQVQAGLAGVLVPHLLRSPTHPVPTVVNRARLFFWHTSSTCTSLQETILY